MTYVIYEGYNPSAKTKPLLNTIVNVVESYKKQRG